MSASRPASMWFGLLGAPFAWVAQFLVGYAMSEAACGTAGEHWDLAVDGVTAIATGIGASVATLAGLTSLMVWRDSRPAEGAGGAEEPPPRGRVHFLATVGIVIAPLFLFIIVMGGLGAIVLPQCRQS